MTPTLEEIRNVFPIGTIYCPTNTSIQRVIKTNNFRINSSYVILYIDENGKTNDREVSFCVWNNHFAKIISKPLIYEIY